MYELYNFNLFKFELLIVRILYAFLTHVLTSNSDRSRIITLIQGGQKESKR